MAKSPEEFVFRGVLGEQGFPIPLDVVTGKAGLARFLGMEMLVRVTKWTARRSHQANNYYWAVVVEAIAEYTGYTKKETHILLKQMFLTEVFYVCDEKTGEVLKEVACPMESKNLSRKQFQQFVEQCECFGTTLGIEWQPYNGDKYAPEGSEGWS